MTRKFLGSKDESVVILKNLFFDNNIVLSTPISFDKKNRTGVYFEGETNLLEKLYQYLKDLLKTEIQERCFGRWIAVVPPTDFESRIILHYEASVVQEKIKILNFVLRKHLMEICNLYLSQISELIIRYKGITVQESSVVMPIGMENGTVLLSETKIIL